MVDQVDASVAGVDPGRGTRRAGHVDHVGHRACDLDAGRAAADDHEVERARVDERAVAVGVSKQPRIRDRSRWASSSEYSGNACSARAGVSKKFGCEPAARTSASPVHVCRRVA